MNALAVLHYGHLTLTSAIDAVPASLQTRPGACGVWSPKDIVAHLSSYEWLLADVIVACLGDDPTPYLDAFRDTGERFNDDQVATRHGLGFADAVAEYVQARDRVVALTANLLEETFSTVGTIPWYGPEYSLDDLIVYLSYGHKREHAAQIAAFLDRESV